MATVKSNQIVHKAGTPYQLTANQKAAVMNSSKPYENQQVVVSNEDLEEPSMVYVEEGNFTENGTFTAPSGKSYNPVTVNVSGGGGGGSQTATPTFSPAAGQVAPGTPVAIACSDAGATIHYTTDGTEPTLESATYTEPIEVNAAMTIKAVAVILGKATSKVASASYTLAYPSYFGFINGTVWGEDADRLAEIQALDSAVQENVEFTHDYTSAAAQEDGTWWVYAHPAAIGTVAHVKDKVNNINYDESVTYSTVQIHGVDYQLTRLTTYIAPEVGTTYPITYSANVIQ